MILKVNVLTLKQAFLSQAFERGEKDMTKISAQWRFMWDAIKHHKDSQLFLELDLKSVKVETDLKDDSTS